MPLFSVLSSKNFLIAALSLVFTFGSNGYPIINSDYHNPVERLTSSPKGIETKEYSWSSTRAQMDYANNGSRKTYKVHTNSPIRGVMNSDRKKKHQSNSKSIPVSEIIPKDPNSFFHPASLRQFKSSVASFEVWKHLDLFPDAHRLSRDKAQDVAAKINHFIEEFSSVTPSHQKVENPNSNL